MPGTTGAVHRTAPVARPGRRRAGALLAAAVVLSLGACSGDDGVDREAAVRDVLARGGGTLTEDQAVCYVDRVLDEIGPAPLAPDHEPSDAQLRRLTAIRVDCIGVGQLGRPPQPSGTAPVPLPTVPGPRTLGDDPRLDELWAGCEGGDGAACDELFDEAPLGSEYEAFGATCGGRGAEASCAAAYPAVPSSTTTTAGG